MKLLFDFSGWLEHKERGIGRYLTSLVCAVNDFRQTLELSIDIVLPEGTESEVQELQTTLEDVNVFNGKTLPVTHSYDFLVVGDFFASASWLSLKNLKNCKKIVGIVYDLIPLIFGGNYLNKDLKKDLKYALSLESLYIPDHLFAISESTKNDLIRFIGLDKNKISTLISGSSRDFFVHQENIVPFNERENSILMISGDDRRKNYEAAVVAFFEAKKKNILPADASFLIVCKESENFRKNIESISKNYPLLASHVKVLGYVQDKELHRLLRKAKLTIFPSKYEGLGLPILESFASGTPCVSSNNSSCRELNSCEFTFDPYSVDEISQKLGLIYNSIENWSNCLKKGREIISRYNWSRGSSDFLGILASLNSKSVDSNQYLAFFGCFPPQESGIAHVNNEFLKKFNKSHAFLEPFDFVNYRAHSNLEESLIRCFSSELFELLNYYYKYETQVFVLGDSFHNLNTLINCINSHIENSWLYLHEAECHGLLRSFSEKIGCSLEALYSLFYDQQSNKRRYGLIPLIRLTGIKQIIVNNSQCRDLVASELVQEKKLRIVKAFHPIEWVRRTTKPGKKRNGVFVIGSFGAPSSLKGTHIVIKAVERLVKMGVPVKLVIAGYCVKRYFSNLDIPPWLQAIDSPSDEELQKLEEKADISVQLRLKPHGETSGVISQLLGLGSCIVTTKGFVDEDLSSLVTEVDPRVTDLELANTLKKLIVQLEGNCNFEEEKVSEIFNKRSYHSLGEFLIKHLIPEEAKNNDK